MTFKKNLKFYKEIEQNYKLNLSNNDCIYAGCSHVLLLFGIWPLKNGAMISKTQLELFIVRNWYFVISVFLNLGTFGVYFVQILGKSLMLAENMTNLFVIIFSLVRFIYLTNQIEHLASIINDMNKNFVQEQFVFCGNEGLVANGTLKQNAKFETNKKWKKLATQVFRAYFYSGLCNILMYNVRGIVTSTLPFAATFPFDTSSGLGLFVGTVHQIISSFITAGWIVACDGFMFYTFIILIGQLKILKASIDSLAQVRIQHRVLSPEYSAVEHSGGIVDREEFKAGLKKCAIHHQNLIRIIQRVRQLFQPLLMVDGVFILIILTVIMLDLAGLSNQLSQGEGDVANKLQVLFVAFTFTLHLGIFCWLGNQITEEEVSLRDSIFALPWYQYPQGMKHDLGLMLRRCDKSIDLDGGPFYILNLSTFVAVMKFCISTSLVLIKLMDERANV